MRIITWTGGSKPRPWRWTPYLERRLVRAVFRQSMELMRATWGDYRGMTSDYRCLNPSTLDTARIHWRRARYDVHATLRG